MEKVGEPITGTFVIDPAGQTETESGDGNYVGATKITGSFNLMRDF